MRVLTSTLLAAFMVLTFPPLAAVSPAGELPAISEAYSRPPVEDDVSPMMLLMSVAFVLICVLLIVIGLVVGAIGMVLLAGLTFAGIISSSVVVGLLRRRFSSGWRTFLVLGCVVLFIPCGAALGWALEQLAAIPIRIRWSIVVGAFAGAAAGVGFAFAFDHLLGRAARRLQRFLPKLTSLRRRGESTLLIES